MSQLRTRFAIIVGILLVSVLLAIPPEDRPLPEKARNWMMGSKIHLGLDLRGGAELIYQIPEGSYQQESQREEILNETVEILRKRIEASRIVADPDVRRRGRNEVLIQLPDLTEGETAQIVILLQSMGKMEFRLAAGKRIGEKGSGIDYTEEDEEWKIFEPLSVKAREDPERRRYEEKLKNEGAHHGERKRGYQWYPVEKPDPGRQPWRLIVLWEIDEDGNKVRLPVFEGSQLKEVGLDRIPELQPTFEFQEDYKYEFGQFTGKHVGEPLAILYDDTVISDPVIDEKLPGQGVITGLSRELAQSLVTVMKSGRLSVKPVQIANNQIGPSLGADSVKRGIQSFAIGLVLVALYMILYYRVPGVLACGALAMNLVMAYAAMVLTGATLTLPGIAGLILTVGMSVDANIIIFERVREERERGKTLDQAIRNGHERAFLTIFDSNVTTLIAAAILYFFGSGPVQGFAVALFWGIACSMFTAIFVTNSLLQASLKGGLLKEFKVMNLMKGANYAWIPKRRLFIGVSLALIVAGLAFFGARLGDLMGIDLKGGITVQARLREEKNISEIREIVKDDFPGAQVNALVPTGEKSWGHALGGTSTQFSITAADIPLTDLVAKKSGQMARLATVRDLETKAAEAGRWPLDAEERALFKLLEMLEAIDVRARTQAELDKAGDKDPDKVRFLGRLPRYEEEQVSLAYLEAFLREKLGGALAPEAVSRREQTKSGGEEAYILEFHLSAAWSWEDVHSALFRASSLFKAGDRADWFTLEPLPGWGGERTGEDLDAEKKKIAESQDDPEKRKELEYRNYRATIRAVVSLPEDRKISEEMDAWKKPLFPKDDQVNWTAALEKMEKEKLAGDLLLKALRDYKVEGKPIFPTLLSSTFPSSRTVGEAVSEELKKSAVTAVLISFLAMLVYIGFRFQWRFGVTAVLALVHDILISLGAIALAAATGLVSVELDLTVIAALLTLVGYSINDTIVVYDRIRENLGAAKQEFPDMVNSSINQTLGRTIGTSFTTMLVLLVMFFANRGTGGVVEGFSFVLTFGIVTGTYSSIGIASALVVEWWVHDRRKKFVTEPAPEPAEPSRRSGKPSQAGRESAPPREEKLPAPRDEKLPEPPGAKPAPKEAPAPAPATAGVPGVGAGAIPGPSSDEDDEEEEEEEETGAESGAAPVGAPGGQPSGPQTGTKSPKGKRKRKRKRKKK